jgi:hypothetical protein
MGTSIGARSTLQCCTNAIEHLGEVKETEQIARARPTSAARGMGTSKPGKCPALFIASFSMRRRRCAGRRRAIPLSRRDEAGRPAAFEDDDLLETLTILGNAEALLERRVILIRFARLNHQRSLVPTAARGRRVAAPAGRRIVASGTARRPMRVSLAFVRPARSRVAVGGKSHGPVRLVDDQVPAGPAKSFVEHEHGGHHRTRRAALHGGTAAAAAASAGRSRRTVGCGVGRGRGDLALHEALRIVAVGDIEFPMTAEIDARGRGRGKLVARASGKNAHRQSQRNTHAELAYNEAGGVGESRESGRRARAHAAFRDQAIERRCLATARSESGPAIQTRPWKGWKQTRSDSVRRMV